METIKKIKITPTEFAGLLEKTYFVNVNRNAIASCILTHTDDDVVLQATAMLSSHFEEVFKLCDVFGLTWVIQPRGEWLTLTISF
jgi:hypothetical protein